jgi:acyl-CoA synthetase (AMP-forming)/AMP-acid ligase II
VIHWHSLDRAARYYAQRTALASEGRRSTFRELYDRVAGLAALLTRRGVRKGDRLALLLPNGPDYVELVYACSWLGAIAVPLNTRLSVTEIDRVLANATPRGLIRHSSMPEPAASVPWQVVVDQELLDVEPDLPPVPLYDPDAMLALIYTSGTTGRPKGVALTHASAMADVDHVNYWMPYREGGVYLHAAPMFHIADFPLMFAAPAVGAAQVTLPRFSAESFCATVERERVTHTVLVPTMINLLTQYADLKAHALGSVEVLGYGGSPMAPELIRRTRAVLPQVKLVQVYGLSETGFLTGLQDHEHTEARLLSCGRPCPGVDLRVVDEWGQELATGEAGEIVTRGTNVMPGYWNDPQETLAAFRNGMFRTGDIGYQDADGYVYIRDRLKDMIVSGGENVYSGEVEAVLYAHPAIREAAVFGVPDSKWGELVMACVVLKPGQALTVDELIAYCRRSLASYKVPRRVEFSDTDLPISGSGKILKRALRERFWAKQQRAVS